MAVTVREELMAVGDWSMDFDYSPELHAEVVDKANNNRPRKVHVLVYDANNVLMYPPLLLLRVEGDDRELTIGGRHLLWYLGNEGIGSLIEDREYVSLADKLSNGSFDLGDLYWVKPGEDSLWVIANGAATNAGGMDGDDLLQPDEKFPTRPGYQYRAQATGVTGTGKLRLRTMYEGKFNPPNLLVDPSFSGTSWSTTSHISIVSGAMRIAPITKPQLATDPGFETGTGWTLTGTAGDMALLNDAAQAYAGSWSMRAGPNAQPQLIQNSGFETGNLNYWDNLGAVAGTWGPTNVGSATAHGGTWVANIGGTDPAAFRQLASNANVSPPATGITLISGRRYRFTGNIRPTSTADGKAWIGLQLGQTVNGSQVTRRRMHLGTVRKGTIETDEWNHINTEIDIPSDVGWFILSAISEEQTTGNYYFDDLQATLIEGNTATMTESTPRAVVAGTTYQAEVRIRSAPTCTGGRVRVGVKLTGAGMEDELVEEYQDRTDAWVTKTFDVMPGDGYTHATRYVVTEDVLTAPFYIDNFTLTQTDNNRDSSVGAAFTLTPGRTYLWKETVWSGANLFRGEVVLSVTGTRPGYDPVTYEASMSSTDGEKVELTLDITPPSGYEQWTPTITGIDVEGDYWWVDDGDLRDSDDSTAVFDTAATSPAAATVVNDSTAPDGAEWVRVMLVTEQGTTGWTVGGVSLARRGVTAATGNSIVAQLLTDPGTGLPLSISAGTITCPEVIPHDWHLVNLTNREALDHYCNVVSDPPREYHVNTNRTINVGTAATVFTDHSPSSASPIVLLPEDIDVEDIPNIQSDAEDRPTEILVIGAIRHAVTGNDYPITATAQVPGPVEVDFNQRPMKRTKRVVDGTIDHGGYAQALADDLAAKEAEPPLSVTITLTGRNTRPAFKVGDWIYIYEPESGLEDVDNVMTVEGQTIFPRKVRVLSRPQELGPAHRIEIRREDGTIYVPPKPRWSDSDATTLVVGDRLQDWVADPQAQAEGVQYIRDRASAPR